ncbi:MAG TPA: hypothetical protein DCM05_10460 [Elusimicrobia bacterium]|nr:hypothetical protein [Elusimicrobiota bacterium]
MEKQDADARTKLIILSDEPVLLSYLERLASERGWQVGVCTTPVEFLAASAVVEPQYVVVDVDMRCRLSGPRVCSMLRDALPACRFLLLSGDGGNIRECREAGFRIILEKPFAPEEFWSAFGAG